MRIFIHNVDTFLGRTLVAELRRSEEAGSFHRVFGTVAKSRELAPAKVKRIVSRDDPKNAKKMMETIQSCALVIMDLFNSTVEDLHFLMQALKVDMKQTPPKPSGELEQDMTVILISSVMVWAATPLTEGVLRDSDWERREPMRGSKYEQWRDLENLVLSTFNQGEEEEPQQIKGFVVAGGALYGEGEDTFGRIFKDAWCGLQDHSITAPGTNRIPMIHVRDLARCVRQLAYHSPDVNPRETPYFLAVDQPPYEEPPPEPVRSPSPEAQDEEAKEGEEGEGDEEGGEDEAQKEDQEAAEEAEEEAPADAEEEAAKEEGDEEGDEAAAEDEKQKTKPSTQAEILQGIVDEMAEHYDVPIVEESLAVAKEAKEGDDEFPDPQDTMSLDLVVEPSKLMLDEEFATSSEPPGWWCREGMLVNMRKIASEFCTQRKLHAVRVVVAGPPASGKSTLCQAISEHFRIPRLGLNAQDLETTASRLSGNVCRYRGFVLDAGLVGFEEVEKLFCYDAEVEKGEDEEEEEEEAEPPEEPEEGEEGQAERPKVKTERRINADLCPTFVIVTQAPEGLCRARFRNRNIGALAAFEEQHNTYAEKNLKEGQQTFTDFFQDMAKMGVLNLPVAGKDEEEMFESVRIYMEKAGRPFNYLPTEAEVTAQILERLAEKEKESQSVKVQQEKTAKASKEEDEEEYLYTPEQRAELIARHLEEHARLKEIPLREYLMRFTIPALTEGLIEMCKVLPDNPADYLATYLENAAPSASPAY